MDAALSSHATTLPARLKEAFGRLISSHKDDEVPEPAFDQGAAVETAWGELLSHYGQRPGMLLRSLSRLIKNDCPHDLLASEALAHAESYSLPTLVRTLTIMSEASPRYRLAQGRYATFSVTPSTATEWDASLRSLLRELVTVRLRALETPLKGKRIHLDTSGVSLVGSLLLPNDVGSTGTAWPPVGIAYDVPDDRTVRFFTFWYERHRRVDVDLHFAGIRTDGGAVNIGWNASYNEAGLVTSGDITTSNNSVEYLDADMGVARASGVLLVVQQQHIYSGAQSWEDISTCYSGAVVVKDKETDVTLYNAENVLFRDDLTGKGRSMSYAVVNFPGHYVRILRGANLPAGDVEFSLGDYLALLLEAQGATLVETPEEAELRVCVGRSDDPSVISLFDEGFYLA